MPKQQVHSSGPNLSNELLSMFRRAGVRVEDTGIRNTYNINKKSCCLTYHNHPLEECLDIHPLKYFFNISANKLNDEEIDWLIFIGGRNISNRARPEILSKCLSDSKIPTIIEHVFLISTDDFLVTVDSLNPDHSGRYKFHCKWEGEAKWQNINMSITGEVETAGEQVDPEHVFLNDFYPCLEIEETIEGEIQEMMNAPEKFNTALQLLQK